MGNWNLNRKDIYSGSKLGNGVILDSNKLCVSKEYYGSNGTVNKTQKPFVMFAMNAGKDLEQDLAELFLMSNVKKVKGCYKDQMEDAYILVLTCNFQEDLKLIDRLERLCKHYNQESYLIVEENRDASLVYLDGGGKIERIGKFVRSNPAEAISLGNWTLDGSTFWICK